VSDDGIVVGARDDNDQMGAIYLYARVHDDNNRNNHFKWTVAQIIFNPVASTNRVGFGFSVDISGPFVAVSAQFENAVFVFQKRQ